MHELTVIRGREPDPFLDTLDYRGSGGELVRLRCTGGGVMVREWFWRHPAGPWHGPFHRVEEDEVLPGEETPEHAIGTSRYYDEGKSDALLNSSHAFGKSGVDMDWTPVDGKVVFGT